MLHLKGAFLGDAFLGDNALPDLSTMRGLTLLDLHATRVTPAGAASLARPDLTIELDLNPASSK